MADYVPMMTAALAAAGVYGALDGTGARQGAGGGVSSASRPRGAGDAVRSALRRLGAAVPACVRDTAVMRACCAELARTKAYARVLRAVGAEAPRGEVRAHSAIGAVEAADSPTPFLHARAEAELQRGMLVAALCLGGMAGALALGGILGFAAGAAAIAIALAVRAARRAREERQRIASAMPEAFAALAIALGSGHTLAQGMRFVGSHAEEPVRGEFLRVACAVDCGIPASDALDDLLARLPAPGLGLVSLALKVSQRTGAPLRGLLAEAAEMAGERIALMRQLDVKTSQARMSARLVALMPIAMVGALAAVSVDFRNGLATPVGAGCVAVALVLDASAWVIIRRIMRIDVG